jgi:hypothetical protein
MQDEEAEAAGRDHPLWARGLIAAIVLAGGAAIGGAAGGGWGGALVGALVAAPVAALGFMVPGFLLGILLVLQVFSCAS